MRQRATQCLGKLPDKPRSRASNPTSPLWPGHHVRSHELELIEPSSPVASVTSERLFRSRETVKAWLEASPKSVLDNHLVDEISGSSFESHDSSPASSEYRGCSNRFGCSSSRTNRLRARAISPPKCPANINSEDVSRIDTGRCGGSNFLVHVFKDAQHFETPSPSAFQYAGAFRDDHLRGFAPEECGSPGSEFSLTSEWHNMVAAGTAAGMSTRGSTSNSSDFDTHGGLRRSRLNLGSSDYVVRTNPRVSRSACRTQSMELPRLARFSELSTGRQFEGDTHPAQIKTVGHSAPLKRTYSRQPSGDNDVTDLQRLSRGNSECSASMREAFAHVSKQKALSPTDLKYANRYEREVREHKSWEEQQRTKAASALRQIELKLELKRARLIEKMQNEVAVARRKADEKKAIAEAKRADKAARAAMDVKIMRRPVKNPRGCLFLG